MDRDEKQLGIINKYIVSRINDPERKHKDCKYFVLDPKHDKYAKMALQAYAVYCWTDYPQLANEIMAWISDLGFELGGYK